MLRLSARFLIPAVLVAFAHGLRADDVLFLETLALGGALTRTWTAPDRQRTEVSAEPGSDFAKMMADVGGEVPQVRIVRLDLGVAWTLNAAEQSYIEEPLTLPYEPVHAGENTDGPAEEPAQEPPPLQLKQVSQPRDFAGYSATGLELWGGDQRLGTLWVAPTDGPLGRAQSLLQTFYQRETETRFKGWPAKDRALFQGEPDLLAATPVAGTLWGGAATRFDQLRNVFVLALQAGSNEPGLEPDALIMQVRAVRLETPPADAFDLPEGFKKVEAEAGH